MRVIFAGTPEFAARALQALLEAGHELPLVLTQPDRPAGRGLKPRPSPVKTLALAHHLPVLTPTHLRDAEIEDRLSACRPDVMVVAAYGLLLPKTVLAIPRFGCLNIHASLLPRWRGAAPIERALLAGDGETGITIMQMDEGLDTGPCLLARRIPIGPDDTAGSLHDKLARLGASTIVEALVLLAANRLTATPQDEAKATYAAKVTKEEAAIDWHRPAEEIARKVRAFWPRPVAYTYWRGETLRIHEAYAEEGEGPPGTVLAADGLGIRVGTGTGVLRIAVLQRPGGRPLPAAAFLAGHPVVPGSRLGE